MGKEIRDEMRSKGSTKRIAMFKCSGGRGRGGILS